MKEGVIFLLFLLFMESKIFLKYKNIFLLFFLVAAFLFSSIFFLKPKVSEIFDFRRKINQRKRTLAVLTQKVATLNGLDEFELEKKAETLLRVLPSEKDIVTLLLTLKALSFREGVTIRGIQIDPREDSVTSLKIEGEKEKIINFLKRVQTSYPLMKLEEVILSFSKDEEPIEAKIVIQTFFQPLPKDLGDVDSPLLPIAPEEEKSYEEVSKFNQVIIEEDLGPVQTGKENPFL